ncbi:MAG: hypothetical protein JG782_1924 [Anaerophaga sp.]|nr:hypothetical protein [Anaerophaga sp.]MDK2841930.1 hypothetical protein [Anaerophaga sp.]MDN5292458.1 hypothetical protein [Anaerophaga sp.]
MQLACKDLYMFFCDHLCQARYEINIQLYLKQSFFCFVESPLPMQTKKPVSNERNRQLKEVLSRSLCLSLKHHLLRYDCNLHFLSRHTYFNLQSLLQKDTNYKSSSSFSCNASPRRFFSIITPSLSSSNVKGMDCTPYSLATSPSGSCS